jgi:NAD-dependent dihydropyrimidine dehydrogenase PreA subunit
MCDTLTDGEVWYLDPRMYSNRMYKLREPDQQPQQTRSDGQAEATAEAQGAERPRTGLQGAIDAKVRGDMETHDKIIAEMNRRTAMRPGSQVVPLFESMKVADMGVPMAAMMCICRKNTRATEESSVSEYSCMGLGTGMYKWERWPERYSGGVEFLSPKQAKEWMEYWNRKGMVQILMQEGGDFIGGFCNCDYPDCLLIRNRIDYGLDKQLVKSEYVFFVDFEKCNGCGDCLGRCQFNALKWEATTEKAQIDQFSCFGCGVCDTACPRQAIYYVERKKLPGLAREW